MEMLNSRVYLRVMEHLLKKDLEQRSFSGTFGHTGFTKVHDGTLLLGTENESS